MIKRLIVWLIVCVVAGCTTATPVSQPLQLRTDQNTVIHLIVAVQGAVKVKRVNWTGFSPAVFGMAVQDADILLLDGSAPASATIVCSDLKVITITLTAANASKRNECNVQEPVMTRGGIEVKSMRENVAGDTPLVITPRKTLLLNSHPTIRWLPVPGAASYTVKISGEKVDWSTSISATTKLVYPNNAPPLVPGGTYLVTVSTSSRSGIPSSMQGMGFTLMTGKDAEAARATETKINALGLAKAPSQLLTATTYAGRQLYAEAIEQLEALPALAQEPAVVRYLGDLYLKIELNMLAEERYRQAFELSKKANDIEGQAIAAYALGLIAESAGKKEPAQQYLQQAVDLYRKLGDATMVRQMQDKLASEQK